MGDCSPSRSKLALCCWCPCMDETLPCPTLVVASGHSRVVHHLLRFLSVGFSHSAVFTCLGSLFSSEWCVSDYSMAVLFWRSISCVVTPGACKWKYSGTHPAVCTGFIMCSKLGELIDLVWCLRLFGCSCRSCCPQTSLVQTSSDLVLWSALHSTLTLRAPVSFRWLGCCTLCGRH